MEYSNSIFIYQAFASRGLGSGDPNFFRVVTHVTLGICAVRFLAHFPFTDTDSLPFILNIVANPFLTLKYICFIFLIYLSMQINHLLSIGLLSFAFPSVFRYRPVFRSPWQSKSLHDFWAFRWNLVYKDTFHRIVFQPMKSTKIEPLANSTMKNGDSLASLSPAQSQEYPVFQETNGPRKKDGHSALVGSMLSFVWAAVLHEYFLYVFFRTISLENLVFFLLHGLLLLTERTLFPREFTGVFRYLFNAFIFFSTLPLFANPFIRNKLFERTFISHYWNFVNDFK